MTLDSSGNAQSFNLDTTGIPDGTYGLRHAVDQSGKNTYATIPVRGVIIDDAPPAVTMNPQFRAARRHGDTISRCHRRGVGRGIGGVRARHRRHEHVDADRQRSRGSVLGLGRHLRLAQQLIFSRRSPPTGRATPRSPTAFRSRRATPRRRLPCGPRSPASPRPRTASRFSARTARPTPPRPSGSRPRRPRRQRRPAGLPPLGTIRPAAARRRRRLAVADVLRQRDQDGGLGAWPLFRDRRGHRSRAGGRRDAPVR